MSTQTTESTSTHVDQRPDGRLSEPGDHERLAHYVKKDQLEAAIFNGTSCTALCGKVWTPTRDPQKFPVCPECKEIYEQKNDDLGDGGDHG